MAALQLPDSRDTRRPSVASQTFFKFGDINEKYDIGKVIGTGNYAEVRHAIHKETGEEVAVKILPVSKDTSADILNEIDILARVNDHPHVVQLREIYERGGRMYIVMELVTGGELFQRIIDRQCFSEKDARDFLYVLIQTISHMHSFGIVHRDLKPENILFTNPSPDAPIKIADFGLAKLSQFDLKTLCGTPGYVAPEVLKSRNGYTSQCDMWSIGVILYVMLCGYPPFQHEQQNKLFKLILKADYHFHSPWWDKVSVEAKDLVRRLLVVDPSVRLTPQEALQHPWMTKSSVGASVDESKLQEYVRRIHKRKYRTLKNALAVVRKLEALAVGDSPASPDTDIPSIAGLSISSPDLSIRIPPGPPPGDPCTTPTASSSVSG